MNFIAPDGPDDDAPDGFTLLDFLIGAVMIALACGAVWFVLATCGEKLCW